MEGLIARILSNPKTTIGGLLSGSIFATAGALVLAQAGCNFEHVAWWEVVSLFFAGPAVQGALSTDSGKAA
jgi:hypothetical protein